MRLIKIVPPLLALLLLGFGGWRLSRYIASKHQAFQGREFAQAHPLLYWLGPNQSASQNGYTLLAVQDAAQSFQYSDANGNASYQSSGDSSHRGDLAFWLRLDNRPGGMPGYASSSAAHNANYLTVTAHSSTGNTFSLDWDLDPSQSSPLLHAAIPPGYPDTCRWADLTVADIQGHTATWRINHLPPMQHQIVPPVAGKNVYNKNGVHFAFAAWREHGAKGPIVHYRLRGHVGPFPRQWDLETNNGEQWEWGTGQKPTVNYTSSISPDESGHYDVRQAMDASSGWDTPIPFLRDQHYLRFFATLHQAPYYMETVTFHNVPLRKNSAGAWCIAPPRLLSLTSPSGITVTLPDVSTAQINGQAVSGTGIWYSLTSTPRQASPSLPQSPLWRKYRQPLDVFASLTTPSGYRDGGGEGDGRTNLNYFTGPVPASRRLDTLTVSIQQKVTLQTIPMTFTVPIGDHP